ncbi:MAG: hypothetical protein J6S67_20800 [Methanobrevibacter sp.]|nr:hypothetical protein [Methanobrevibacter sp.]
MKVLITKSDGTPTKSKVFAIKYLQDKGISENCLIQENGQFFYEEEGTKAQGQEGNKVKEPAAAMPVTWETPVFTGNERTKLFIPNTDINAVIIAKHPGGQIRPVSSFEISIGTENFIMSLDLVSKLFKVRG